MHIKMEQLFAGTLSAVHIPICIGCHCAWWLIIRFDARADNVRGAVRDGPSELPLHDVRSASLVFGYLVVTGDVMWWCDVMWWLV